MHQIDLSARLPRAPQIRIFTIAYSHARRPYNNFSSFFAKVAKPKGIIESVPRATNAHINIEYETFGSPDDPAIICIPGLGSQLLSFPLEFCMALVDRGFFVLRMDNRDSGLSTLTTDKPPYTLDDMADDVVAVLDHAGLDKAILFGVSMGGMIAQSAAIRHPSRTTALVSVMSTTGQSDVGQPTLEAWDAIIAPPQTTIEGQIEADVRNSKIWSNPDWFDEKTLRNNLAIGYERAFHPGAAMRQVEAILLTPNRAEGLKALEMPALIVHGALDTLIDPSGGARTAELIPNSRYLLLDEMSHDFVPQAWPPIIEAVTTLASEI